MRINLCKIITANVILHFWKHLVLLVMIKTVNMVPDMNKYTYEILSGPRFLKRSGKCRSL